MTPGLLTAENHILAETTIVLTNFRKDYGNNANENDTNKKSDADHQLSTKKYKLQLVWTNILAFIYLHLGCLYGFYLIFTVADIKTTLLGSLFAVFSGIGITAGAHRLWAHRSYKANVPMRIILGIMQTIAFQNHIYEWVRDHRVHHKFTETDADPHNAKRGFFFSHIGWLMVRKHPDVKEKGKQVDMSDMEADPIVMFQKKHYLTLMPLFCFMIPTFIPWLFWGEQFWVSWYVATLARFTMTLHFTWFVNSAAHIWGTRPYDKNFGATQNLGVALGALGEGWHNYHHVFPWDYKAAELGNYRANVTTAFIDFFHQVGWAYDLKTVPMKLVRRRVLRTGDGTHGFNKEHSHNGQVWGWGDENMEEEDRKNAEIIH